MKRIPLTQGKVAMVDDADFEYLSQFKWCFSHGYAQTRGRGKKEYMHRVIMNPPADKQVDHKHKTLEGLDNRRSNLRVGTSSDNQHNRGKNRNNTSGYKCISRSNGKWIVGIMKNYRNYGGRFNSLGEAISARDTLISRLHGDFAKVENV